ncbi:natural resistance-associated macrophage protein-domain-containing protein [Cokeromyces recurvatus]|uniref:natural resistance-associated macrophage protein-domain-containing protein n=1 Tax=Cokeromyces recurvatus TaxID=90255 RepID=UPI0022202BE3|nr:natural resistance-associated macrophage protein-domain-containing protein [Cokeromyces recurvatus]KAI7903370.1 natural resistance-associated macrophage protein-domain-containing protein [Cokeromyces recurvatus]
MVPHDARRLSDDVDVHNLEDSEDPLILKGEQFDSDINHASQSSNRINNNGLFGDDLEIKPEVDTGRVSESCFSFKKLWKYMGPGWLMSIAYLDPGNLESDLQTGAVAGYSLLWLLFWAHVIGLFFQLLSARLGTITGKHLAQLIRQNYPKRLAFVLWIFAQFAIIGADILEIVGTAVALHILLRLPLWAGVLMTATDTFTFMMIQRYGIRRLEAFFMVLISIMAVCFWVEMIQSKPDVRKIVEGVMIPMIPKNAEFQAVAMLGAIVMPHNMFLHSALVMSRDLGKQPSVRKLKEANFYFAIESILALWVSFFVNLAIVVVFAQVFFKPNQTEPIIIPGLDDADAVLSGTLGSAAKYLWAAGLLAAGQSSTMTGTLAGQYVTEGFFGNIFKKDWHRVAVTRCISLIPGMLVAIFAVDHFDTMGELLNVLQSVCLPTVLIPIIKLSTSSNILSKEFRPSTILQITCWSLTVIVIAFDIFLFIKHATSQGTAIVIGISGTIYLLFLVYLLWKPLCRAHNLSIEESDDWMSLSQYDTMENSFDESPLLSLNNSNKSNHHVNNNIEEVYSI